MLLISRKRLIMLVATSFCWIDRVKWLCLVSYRHRYILDEGLDTFRHREIAALLGSGSTDYLLGGRPPAEKLAGRESCEKRRRPVPLPYAWINLNSTAWPCDCVVCHFTLQLHRHVTGDRVCRTSKQELCTSELRIDSGDLQQDV